jgi:hypothetical protein
MAEELLLAQHRNLPGEWRSTQMIVRLGLRLLIIAAFASFGSIGFARGFAALPWMSTILCAVVGIIKHERPFDVALNHWDEAAAYAALFCLARAVPA